MESRRERLRRRLRLSVLVSLLISFYVTGVASTFKSDRFFVSYNPKDFLISFRETGFYWQLFLGLLLISLGISLLLIRKAYNTQEGSDNGHPRRKLSDSGIYGTAEFERPWQYRSLAQIRPIEDAVGHVLGQLDNNARECIDVFPDPKNPKAHINEHIFAIGASGSGKTFTVGKTYCYQSIKLGHSVIVTDPKGELFRDMADCFRKHGYVVRRLNFSSPKKSDGWDCMKTLRMETEPERIELNAALFASAVVRNIVDNPNSIYYTGPVMLLQALILRLVLDDSGTYPDEEKNIKTVYGWLTHPDGMSYLDKLFDPAMMPPRARPCISPYTMFKSSSPNLLGNLKTNLGAGIQILSTGIISEMLSTDDIDLTLPAQTQCAYFIQFPVPNDPFKFPLALFFTMLFQSLQDYATTRPNLRLPVTVDTLLDEFAQCGVLPSWDERMSVIRSYGINVFMIVQTIAQFRKNYDKAAETIISNCATWLMLGANDADSAEYISQRLGKTSVVVESESREGIRKLLGLKNRAADRTTQGVGGSELLSADEVQKLEANQELIIFQRHNPIWANTIPHTLHPYSKDIEPTYDADEPDLDDYEAKRVARAKENEFRLKYYQTHMPFVQPDNIDDAPYLKEDSLLDDLRAIFKEDFRFITRLFPSKKESGPKKKKASSEAPPAKPAKKRETAPEKKKPAPKRPEPPARQDVEIDLYIDDLDENDDVFAEENVRPGPPEPEIPETAKTPAGADSALPVESTDCDVGYASAGNVNIDTLNSSLQTTKARRTATAEEKKPTAFDPPRNMAADKGSLPQNRTDTPPAMGQDKSATPVNISGTAGHRHRIDPENTKVKNDVNNGSRADFRTKNMTYKDMQGNTRQRSSPPVSQTKSTYNSTEP